MVLPTIAQMPTLVCCAVISIICVVGINAAAPLLQADSPDLAYLSIQRLGKSTAAASTLRNVSPYPLENLGTCILITHFITAQARYNYDPNQAVDATDIEVIRKNIAQGNVKIANPSGSGPKIYKIPDATARSRYRSILHDQRSMFSQNFDTATRIAERFKTLLAALKGAFDIKTKKPVKSEFLLDLYISQEEFLRNSLKTQSLREINSKIQQDAAIKDAYRHLESQRIRYAIQAHRTQVAEFEEDKRAGRRTSLYDSYHTSDYKFTRLEEVPICKIEPSYCIGSADGTTTVPPSTTSVSGGRKKRSTMCFHRFCLEDGNWIADNVMDHTAYHYRQKRSFTAIGSVISLIGSVATAIYTSHEINAMRMALANQNEAVSEVVENIAIAQNDISLLNRKVDKLTDSTLAGLHWMNITQIDLEMVKYSVEVQGVLVDLEERLAAVELGFTSLRNRQFPYSIVKASEMEAMYKQLVEKTALTQQELMLDDWTGLYTTTTDLILVDGFLYLVQNIPVIGKSKGTPEFFMYTLSNRPILLANTTFTFSQPKPYVILDDKASMYKSLSQLEFNDCQVFNHKAESYFHCSRMYNVFRKDTSRNCLVKLFKQDYADLHDVCDVHVGHLQDYVSQLSRNEFMIYSPQPDMVTIQCPHEATRIEQIHGFENITIGDGCDANTQSHHIFSAYDAIFHHALVEEHKRVDLRGFFQEFGNLDDSLKVIAEHLESIKGSQPREMHLEKAKELLRKAKEQNQTGYWFSSNKYIILSVIVGFCGITLIVGLTFLLCQYYCAKRMRTAAAVRIHREPEPEAPVHNVDEVVELRQPIIRQIQYHPANEGPIVMGGR